MKKRDDNRSNGLFWAAVNAAREITERHPDEDQPEEHGALVEAMEKLDLKSQQGVVWQVIKQVLEGITNIKIQAAFAVARIVRPQMTYLVHNAAVVNQLVRQKGISLQKLIDLGLAEIRTREGDDKAHVVYKIGLAALGEAAEKLTNNGEVELADVLHQHLRRNERWRLLAAAQRTARAESDESEPDEVPDEVPATSSEPE